MKPLRDSLPTPRVGERIATVDVYYGFGRKGVRLPGFSDPAKRLAWVKFDDGETLGVATQGMVKEKDYPKTVAYKLLKKGD
jgi:hypothetical protein